MAAWVQEAEDMRRKGVESERGVRREEENHEMGIGGEGTDATIGGNLSL